MSKVIGTRAARLIPTYCKKCGFMEICKESIKQTQKPIVNNQNPTMTTQHATLPRKSLVWTKLYPRTKPNQKYVVWGTQEAGKKRAVYTDQDIFFSVQKEGIEVIFKSI